MKKSAKLLSLMLVLVMVATLFVACDNDPPAEPFVEQDYVSQLTLDETSNTKKAIVTVKTYIDGDTTHFNINDTSFIAQSGENVLKARYIAVDTPESTGQLEPWGKAASDFTKNTLKKAVSILVESNDDKWNHDSTGSRYMVFVWYKTTADGAWRNLNLEILQNGLAYAKNTGGNIYGTTCMAALNQAKTLKLNAYSDKPDPGFYYGQAVYTTLKDIRCNLEEYNLKKVAFDCTVTRNYNNGVYVEWFDEESSLYYGMYVYYGNGAKQQITEALRIGNKARVVGSVSEFNGSYQISGLEYTIRNVGGLNTEVIEDGYFQASYKLTSVEDFAGRDNVSLDFVKIDDQGEETVTTLDFDYAFLAMGTTVKMENLVVKNVYTTKSSNDNSDGAMTLTCQAGGKTIKVRTIVLRDDSGNIVTKDAFENKTIDVLGVIDSFDGEYQLKVLNYGDITIK